MQVRLSKPEHERFVVEQVRAGRFSTPEAVVEDALSRMMDENTAPTDADVAAINEADEQIERGEGVEFDAFANRMREKYPAR